MLSRFIKHLLSVIIINSLAVIITIYLVKEIKLTGWDAIVSTILIFTIGNSLIKPFVRLLILPLKIITLGMLNLIINLGFLVFGIFLNAGLFYLVSYIYPKNIVIPTFPLALKAGLVFTILNWIVSRFLK